ncbi:hypothetical protein [Pedobacter nyackensis]|uniref:Uncharacterized protein n=1 Tax=Pedobacter nyackensis TaxID=475255 RepID=A0A1W2DVV9_9SPHI|nr:hypothetical protein [Pedobacter nyackensis]SMD01156.1 hypothetical protein SAMN04488101_108140 [Pedobacter nyackensis]
MDETLIHTPNAVSKEHKEIKGECGANVIEKEGDTSGIAHNLLNLLAEVVVENIVKKIRNGCNRVHKDK